MAIVEEYDRISFSFTILKFHQHLYRLSRVENSFDYKIDKENSLHIFEMVASTNELTKELVN
jgi:hypothetical protein